MPRLTDENGHPTSASKSFATHNRDPLSEDDDFEDDASSRDARTSLERLDDDRRILDEEDERETLLATVDNNESSQRLLGGGESTEGDKRRKQINGAKSNKMSAKNRHRGMSNSMFEMEEGHRSSSESLEDSEADKQRLLIAHTQREAARRARVWRNIIIGISIGILFVVLLLAAYQASKNSRKLGSTMKFYNGTAHFAPTTILVSLDGFRADFLYRGLTPTLNSFVANGISPKYMLPSFPSVTFPNHYTLVTGLYPESHGIVGNTFWDPHLKGEFYYTDSARSLQPKWWGGEPIWLTAEKQGVRTAIHMWPGSEAHIGSIEPTYVDKYNGSEVLSVKVNRILGLLDIPGPDMPTASTKSPRPQLIAAYVPDVDAMGHKFGPNSTEIQQTIQDVDIMLHDLLEGLQARNLTDIVNVVVISDHGMATTDVSRLIQLEDLVDPNELEHIDGWPLYGLRPKKLEDLERLYQQISEKSENNSNFDVYLRDKDMPERYHFSRNDRIAPLWIVPKTGWAIVTKDEFDVEKGLKNNEVYHPRGLHGYDHEHPLMRAIFVARGPAFPHKPGSRVEPFQNIELYNIICDTIGLQPVPNNGTLRLPLKPVGLHSDFEDHPDQIPPDPPNQTNDAIKSTTSLASSLLATSSVPSLLELTGSTVIGDLTINPARPEPTGGSEGDGSPKGNENSADGNAADPLKDWWDWLKDKFDDVKDWGKTIFNDTNRAEGGK